MITINNNKYFYSLYNLFAISHTFNIFENKIDYVISIIRSKNFSAIILDNASAIANAWKHISKKYSHILNICYIVYFVNLIIKNILGNFFFFDNLFLTKIKLIRF